LVGTRSTVEGVVAAEGGEEFVALAAVDRVVSAFAAHAPLGHEGFGLVAGLPQRAGIVAWHVWSGW
jgi:hypothetical protein